MSIGENIRRIREKKNITQKELAAKVFVGNSMICQIERGTKVLTVPLGKAIADALGCSLDDLTS